MNILCIGDIVGRVGRNTLYKYLDKLKQDNNIHLTLCNAENSAHGKGMTRNVYDELTSYGVDVFTMGNHTWGCKDIINVMEYNNNVIRPANFSGECPGRGSTVVTASNGVNVGVINLIGRTYMDSYESPFLCVDKEIEYLKKKTDIIIVDFHAEATSEKIAMGWYLDGKVSAIFGTHTHVQTADDTILPKGSGYITDLGMTGPIYSVLGMERKIIIQRFLKSMPQKFVLAEGKGQLCGCIFNIDDNTHKTISTKRVYIKE